MAVESDDKILRWKWNVGREFTSGSMGNLNLFVCLLTKCIPAPKLKTRNAGVPQMPFVVFQV